MELKFAFFTLLIAATTAKNENGKIRDLSCDREVGQRKSIYKCVPRFKNECIENSTRPCIPPPVTTTTTTTTTSDPCESCRNEPISITDTWAGQCFPDYYGEMCNCVCGDVFCFNGEVIDRSTCTPNGSLQDCRCISTSTVAPTTVPPTEDPTVGCEWCLNDELSVGDTFAGHCFPNPSENGCYCLCADLFCQNGQIIDRSTCVSGGSISNCRCIDVNPPTSPSPEEPSTTPSSEDYDY